MKRKRRNSDMLIPTLIMGVLAVILMLIGYVKGQGQHLTGMTVGVKMFIGIIPLLLFAFTVAGMIQVLIPQEQISKWVGVESGIKGLFIGTIAGGFCPGGPFVSLPIVAGLVRSGASVGTMIAFLTGWALWSITRLPMEIGILGWKFTLIRLATTFFFPPIAGWLGQLIFGSAKLV